MRPKFVHDLSNVRRFLVTCSKADDTGSAEASWILATGEPGFGKSATATWYGLKRNAVHVRAKEAMTPHWLLTDIVRELGEQPERTSEKLFLQIVRSLSRDQRLLILDESEKALRRLEILETLRDITDTVEVPALIFGRENVRGRLAAQPQIWSRICGECRFGPATPEDTQLLFDSLCEVEVAPEVVERVHRESRGLVRDIRTAMKELERVGKRSGGRVQATALDDKPLVKSLGARKAA